MKRQTARKKQRAHCFLLIESTLVPRCFSPVAAAREEAQRGKLRAGRWQVRREKDIFGRPVTVLPASTWLGTTTFFIVSGTATLRQFIYLRPARKPVCLRGPDPAPAEKRQPQRQHTTGLKQTARAAFAAPRAPWRGTMTPRSENDETPVPLASRRCRALL